MVRLFLTLRRMGRETEGDLLKLELLASIELCGDRGTNALSLAECTGLPRETVRRKLRELETAGKVERISSCAVRLSPAARHEVGLLADRWAGAVRAAATRLQ